MSERIRRSPRAAWGWTGCAPPPPGAGPASCGSRPPRRCSARAGDRADRFVGEQPGDQEDRTGEPFVGPAGQLLDRALADAGIDRRDAYVTNAVKHFRFTVKGKRRIHQTPGPEHLRACRPWLEAEFAVLKPEVVVCLGRDGGQGADLAVLPDHQGPRPAAPWTPPGRGPRPTSRPTTTTRGRAAGEVVFATTHPSAILRTPDEAAAYDGLVADLKTPSLA